VALGAQNLDAVENLLDKFMEIDVDGSGCISTEEFFRFISLEPTPFATSVLHHQSHSTP